MQISLSTPRCFNRTCGCRRLTSRYCGFILHMGTIYSHAGIEGGVQLSHPMLQRLWVDLVHVAKRWAVQFWLSIS